MSLNSQQLLQDIEWVVNSPSVIEPAGHFAEKLNPGCIEAEKLVQHIERTSPAKVGRYFESFIEFWLRDVRGLQIIEQQKQLFDQNRTVGEIDFLYQNESSEVTHLEVAVKFYLHYPGQHHSGSHFIGPNSNDNLEAKHRKLFEQQLKLGQQYFENVEKVEAFVKGRIFYHLGQTSSPPLPTMLSPDHLQGNWLYSHELELLDQFEADSQYCLLNKPHWLAEAIIPQASSSMMNLSELIKLSTSHFPNSIRPLLVGQLKFTESCWHECNRFFIVNSQWPNAEKK